jgi:hypothetical protein
MNDIATFARTVPGFESEFSRCIYLNNYVTKGEGDLEDLMIQLACPLGNTIYFFGFHGSIIIRRPFFFNFATIQKNTLFQLYLLSFL